MSDHLTNRRRLSLPTEMPTRPIVSVRRNAALGANATASPPTKSARAGRSPALAKPSQIERQPSPTAGPIASSACQRDARRRTGSLASKSASSASVKVFGPPVSTSVMGILSSPLKGSCRRVPSLAPRGRHYRAQVFVARRDEALVVADDAPVGDGSAGLEIGGALAAFE